MNLTAIAIITAISIKRNLPMLHRAVLPSLQYTAV
jgi:hypothetical protein